MITFKGFIPLIDAHMHLQSNNCAPLPLQWGLVMMKVAAAIDSIGEEKIDNIADSLETYSSWAKYILPLLANTSGLMNSNLGFSGQILSRLGFESLEQGLDIRKQTGNLPLIREISIKADRELFNNIMSAATMAVKDFGRIGTLNTYNVARLFMNDTDKMEVKEYAMGMMSLEVVQKMAADRQKTADDFASFTRYYYNNLEIEHMYVAFPMDLTYASFWGNYGIPVYLYFGDDFYFINDYNYYLSIFENIIYNSSLKNKSNRVEKEGPDYIKKQIDDQASSVYYDAGRTPLWKEIDKITKNLDTLKKRAAHSSIPGTTRENVKKLTKDRPVSKTLIDDLNSETLIKIRDRLANYARDQADNCEAAYKNQDKKEQNRIYYAFYHFSSRLKSDLKPEMEKVIKKVKEFLKEKGLYNYFSLIEHELSLIAGGKPDKPGFATHTEQIDYWLADIRKIGEELKQVIHTSRQTLTETAKNMEESLLVVLAGLGKMLPYDVNPSDYKDYFTCKSWKNEKVFNKNFFHYIEKVPNETHETFENYEKQFNYYLASALRYPFRILPFYHYDPRRHYAGGEKQVDSLISHIIQHHSFFTYKRNGLEKPEITPLTHMDSSYFKKLFGEKGTRGEKGWKMKTSNEFAFHQAQSMKHQNKGLCFGYKMYTELGYPPDLYTPGSFIGEHFDADQFKHVEEFFKHCEKNQIPITCHCSPLGMVIGDSYLYLRADDKENGKITTGKDTDFTDALCRLDADYFLDSLDYVDNNYVFASAWKRVLRKFPKLKLCLAHYSGYSSWVPLMRKYSDKDEDNEYQKQLNDRLKQFMKNKAALRDEITEMLADDSMNIYADLSCYTNKYQELVSLTDREFLELMQAIDNGTDKRFFMNCYTKQFFGGFKLKHLEIKYKMRLRDILMKTGALGYEGTNTYGKDNARGDDLYHVGTALAEILNGPHGTKAKNRILMGSDWPMFEMDITGGIGEYYARMFQMLKITTSKLNTKFDAWHQFAVLNPLRFLGILDDNDEIIMERLEGHKAAIEEKLKNEDWLLNKAKIEDSELSKIPLRVEKTITNFSSFIKIKIKKAEEIKGDGGEDDFIILRD
ncbi:MAG: hypothetical protein JXJ04_23500 [Spirochaetales bacterium]|nr:hypothetical protein [Spirochaetales bacterium]